MDEKQLIEELTRTAFAAISDHIDTDNCDREKLRAGIEQFIRDNGLRLALKGLDRRVVEGYIEKSAKNIADTYKGNTGLFFENYELINGFKVIVNTIHGKMLSRRHGENVDGEEMDYLQYCFDKDIEKISKINGLREFLSLQISEAIADLERLEGKTTGMSIRSKDELQQVNL